MGDETCAEIGPLLPPTEPVVVLKRADRRPSGRCFTAFRRRVIDQESPAKVAEELGVKQRRLRAMVSRVTNWAAQHEQVGNVLAIKIQHTAMLYELWRDARTQYKRSCEEATSHNVTSVKSTGPNGTTEKTTTKVSRHGQSGNPRYLEIADNLLASIRGIWGADAPKQQETNEHREIVIRVVEDTEWYKPGAAIAAALAAPDATPGIAGQIQGDSVREKMGQDYSSPNSAGAGPRPEP